MMKKIFEFNNWKWKILNISSIIKMEINITNDLLEVQRLLFKNHLAERLFGGMRSIKRDVSTHRLITKWPGHSCIAQTVYHHTYDSYHYDPRHFVISRLVDKSLLIQRVPTKCPAAKWFLTERRGAPFWAHIQKKYRSANG